MSQAIADELLATIRRSGDLTIPELVARTNSPPSQFVESLNLLVDQELITITPVDALAELRSFIGEITRRADDRPPTAQRILLLNQTSDPKSLSRAAILAPR